MNLPKHLLLFSKGEMSKPTELKFLKSGECEYLDWKSLGGKGVRRGAHAYGSCLFDVVLACVSSKYREGKRDQQFAMCKEFRQSFADILTLERFKDLKLWKEGKVIDDNCYDEYLKEPKEKTTDQQKLEAFKAYLKDTSRHTGPEVVQLIGDELDIDIYFMKNDDIVVQAIPTECAYKNRLSIIVLHCGKNHYESIGVVKDDSRKSLKDGEVVADFFFPPDHKTIKILYNKQREGWEEYIKLLY